MTADERALLLEMARVVILNLPDTDVVRNFAQRIYYAQQQPPAAPEKAAEPKCETCKGDRYIFAEHNSEPFGSLETCPDCHGTGRQPSEEKP